MIETHRPVISPPRPRPAVVRMKPYSPPTAGRTGKTRLDFNENTQGPPLPLLEVLKKKLTPELLAVYPEYGEVKSDLARFFGVHPDQLLLTNGTDEAIQVLMNTYVDPGEEVVLLQPSYAMYRFYAELAGARIVEVPYRSEDLAFPFQELLEVLGPNTKALLLANPNNPTGTAIELHEIESILAKASSAAVLVDEAYFEFSGITALPLVAQFPNLFVSRTFSKAFGLAGLRLGCLFSQPENISLLHKAQSPYSVNMVAALAVQHVIEHAGFVKAYVEEVLSARELLYQGLARLGIPSFSSRANFVLIRAGDRARQICEALRRKGILVRDRSYELPGCVRITVGTRQQVAQLLRALEEIW